MRLLYPIALFVAASPLPAQAPLHQRLMEIGKAVNGEVSVACSLPGESLDCNLHAERQSPMQSVFKLPLGMAVLHEVELGKLNLSQPVRFESSDLQPGSFSPLQDAHPQGNVNVPLRQLLELSVSQSDNVATDILLRLIGGPDVVERYLKSLGLGEIHVLDSERGLALDPKAQYRNSSSPAAMVKLLRMIADHSPLTPEHTALLNQWMEEGISTPHRIRGLLPPGVVVAHKSGTSGTNDGLTAATNDVGLITLPDGRRLALAVFVTDAHVETPACEAVIARIARAVYEAAIQVESR